MLLLNILVLALAFKPSSQRGRIVGADTIKISKVPYVMQVARNNKLVCGGSLIAPNVVLTAAHCVIRDLNERFSVRGGSVTRNFGEKHIEVIQIILPSKYNTTTEDWDVAILILKSNMEDENGDIEIIKLCDGPVPPGSEVQVSGWGITHRDMMEATSFLLTVYVTTRNHSECVEAYAPEITVTENMICANAKGKDACKGDSGGPMVYDGKICGIVSAGSGCGIFKIPGIYADVNKFSSFIDNALKSYEMLMRKDRKNYRFL